MRRADLLARVSEYYTGAFGRHGCVPAGVDWPHESGQRARFDELLLLARDAAGDTLLDFGCGYGALADHLHARGAAVQYAGFDLSAVLVAAAARRHPACGCRFEHDRTRIGIADYVVASGVFNVKLDTAEQEWRAYVEEVLHEMASLARRGFAFNLLSAHVAAERRRPHLYYADADAVAGWCRREWGGRVAVLHDRWPHEFTVLVRRDD